MRAFQSIQRNWIDFLLAFLAAATATYSVGMGLSNPPLSFLFVGGIAAGSFIAYAVSRMFDQVKWLETLSIFLYIGLALAATMLSSRVNSGLPSGGFPRELTGSAGTLCWMLMLGSFVAWRDQILLFQSIPCIALFGLVGAFNTFNGATLTFFVFMLSIALLYARCHRRVMLDRAVRSGFPHVASLRAGPWRWMAGPEWGLASAAIVIVLSLIGAPILQFSMKQVSGAVSIRPPQLPPQIPRPFSSAVQHGESSAIGQGPRGYVTEREVFRVKLPEARYMRIGAFNEYSKGVWRRLPEANGRQETPEIRRNTAFPFLFQDELQKNFQNMEFKIKFAGRPMDKFPAPVVFSGMKDSRLTRRNGSGDYDLAIVPERGQALSGTFWRLKDSFQPRTSPKRGDSINLFLATNSVSPKVVAWAKELTANLGSDIEKAVAIKAAIERQSKYNLNAEAAPEGVDPVEDFLFGETREGYCDLFASSMAQMARAAGMPARYVVGYFPVSLQTDADGYFIVREADFHAWAEIYFDGAGWLAFDTTEGAEQVPGGERGSARDKVPFLETDLFYWGIRSLLGLLILTGVGLLIRSWKVPVANETLILRRLTDSYGQFVGALEIASDMEKPTGDSPQEFFSRVSDHIGDLKEPAAKLTGEFVPLLFGPTAPSEEVTTKLKNSVSGLAKSAKAYARTQRRKP